MAAVYFGSAVTSLICVLAVGIINADIRKLFVDFQSVRLRRANADSV